MMSLFWTGGNLLYREFVWVEESEFFEFPENDVGEMSVSIWGIED